MTVHEVAGSFYVLVGVAVLVLAVVYQPVMPELVFMCWFCVVWFGRNIVYP